MEHVRWDTGSLAWTFIGPTLQGGVTTLGGGVTNLGVVAILAFRPEKLGCVCLKRTSRIDQERALSSAAGAGGSGTSVVGGAGGGVDRYMSVLGIWFNFSRSLEMVVSCSW